MAILNSLKLVSAKRNASVPLPIQRRNKLIKALHEQIQLANCVVNGTIYAPTKQKKVTQADTGERVTVSVPKRVKQWWFVSDSGKLMLSVKYGAKTLELAKGKNAVEVVDTAAVLETLGLLRQAVEAGEMDAAIDAASTAVRKQFK